MNQVGMNGNGFLTSTKLLSMKLIAIIIIMAIIFHVLLHLHKRSEAYRNTGGGLRNKCRSILFQCWFIHQGINWPPIL